MKYFIKRLLLIIIGITLSLVVLECGLRFAGWTIFSYQQYKNNKALRNKAQYTIMCLGESTTAWQYPVQLQQILNKKYPNKFSIIDKGLPNTRLEYILNSIEDNITEYKPDIAICMMSINDQMILNVYRNIDNADFKKEQNLFNKTKIYKLYNLLKKHIFIKFFETEKIFAKNIEKEQHIKNLEKILQHYHNLGGDSPKIPILAKKLLELDSTNEIGLHNLCIYNWYILENEELAYKTAMFAIKNNTKLSEFYIIAAKYMIKHNIQINNLIDLILNNTTELTISETYKTIEAYLTKEQKNEILNKISNTNDRFLSFKGIVEFNRRNYKQAQEYFDKADKIRINFPNTEICNLYKQILKKLTEKNIKVICMQYPVRSILPLQELLKKESYYNKLTFITNEENFKNALMKRNYDDLFVDQFAGDFGHCTDLGNTLIAKNVVNTLEDILNLRQKSN